MQGIPKAPSVRECLRIGGFKWSEGKIYVPDPEKRSIKRVMQHESFLEEGINSVGHIFAIDSENVFLITLNLSLFPLPVMLPIRVSRKSTGFLDVKINNSSIQEFMRNIMNREGVFFGEGEIIKTPLLVQACLLDKRTLHPVHVVGVRSLGVYVSGEDQDVVLRQLTNLLENELKMELQRRFFYGTDEEIASIFLIALGEARRNILENTSN